MYRSFKAVLAAVAVIVSFAAFVVDAADVLLPATATSSRAADTSPRPAGSNSPVISRSAQSATPADGR